MTDQSQPGPRPETQAEIATVVNQFATAAEGNANDVVITAVAYFLGDVLASTSLDADALETNISLVSDHVATTARQRFAGS